jgi:hypothetical protein
LAFFLFTAEKRELAAWLGSAAQQRQRRLGTPAAPLGSVQLVGERRRTGEAVMASMVRRGGREVESSDGAAAVVVVHGETKAEETFFLFCFQLSFFFF